MTNFSFKSILILTLGMFLAVFTAKAQEEPKEDTPVKEEEETPVNFRISGFVKSDYWFDSRSVVSAREDLFLLYPEREILDTNFDDIFGSPSFNFSAITSRIRGTITGPDAFKARTSGIIEADFSGVSNADINGFRLRHAVMKLQWPSMELMLGQWWHPLFGEEVVPSVISLNTGAPFQPFIRNPQLTMSFLTGDVQTIVSAIAQRDYANDGPQGFSPQYIRNSLLPNLHLQIIYKEQLNTMGIAFDYKRLRPRTITDQSYRTSESFWTYAVMGFLRHQSRGWDIKAKGIYGQNLSEHLMMGGYAESSIDPATGEVTYTPTGNLMTWANIVYGENRQVGLFLGYSKNYGALDPIVGNYYGRGHDIDYLYRIAPSFSVISGKVQFSSEIEYTVAAYGTPDNMGIVRNAQPVGNLRVLLTGFYFF